ncbi:hypothetical protein ISF_07863 [Cordyceps fumosorosea ARSEF 2679]|uniref:Integral membrane protein n=1 Tax=Cordyceps fumosorosea (strain ARSEF 2679) TaxID=1081104 RepID=A0A167NNL2_CORFA|nr:hypothetical protein ISF_07863 [Cordyceps fumosorosea ARSEF 2679]OAA55758.1 hypothetical protein ISF_07863 [Cordyceps fumosorosea ARSEF 2679]
MAAQAPVTTIVPFGDRNKLPQCAVSCKALYDANANCVPPIIPSGPVSNYEACFCINKNVAALSTATDAVCNDVCSAEQGGQASVASWFGSLCHASPTVGTAGTTSTSGAATGNKSSSNNNKSGDWISNHWQWVIMLVVLIVVIAGVWIGACIWRRRYLRRKDRQTSLGQKQSGSASRPSWGPNAGTGGIPASDSASPMNYSGSAEAAYPKFESTEKPKKKKWTVTSRT